MWLLGFWAFGMLGLRSSVRRARLRPGKRLLRARRPFVQRNRWVKLRRGRATGKLSDSGVGIHIGLISLWRVRGLFEYNPQVRARVRCSNACDEVWIPRRECPTHRRLFPRTIVQLRGPHRWKWLLAMGNSGIVSIGVSVTPQSGYPWLVCKHDLRIAPSKHLVQWVMGRQALSC